MLLLHIRRAHLPRRVLYHRLVRRQAALALVREEGPRYEGDRFGEWNRSAPPHPLS